MIEMYTAVLKGHIDLAMTVVPENTRDAGLDLATRQYIYRKGLDYRYERGDALCYYTRGGLLAS